MDQKLIVITAWFLFFALFIVVAASRPANKNVSSLQDWCCHKS